MVHTAVSSQADMSRARARVVAALCEFGLDRDHVTAVEIVTGELLTTALDAGADSVELFVEPYRLLTSVRVRCERNLELDHEPFELRERVLQALTIAFGHRRNLDASTDFWAEIQRPSPARPVLPELY